MEKYGEMVVVRTTFVLQRRQLSRFPITTEYLKVVPTYAWGSAGAAGMDVVGWSLLVIG